MHARLFAEDVLHRRPRIDADRSRNLSIDFAVDDRSNFGGVNGNNGRSGSLTSINKSIVRCDNSNSLMMFRSAFRHPSNAATVGSVRTYLTEIYNEQLLHAFNGWLSLSDQQSKSIAERDLRQSIAIECREDGRMITDLSEELIDQCDRGRRRFSISGQLGSGKTYLLYDLIRKWCADDGELCDQFPILLLIRAECALGCRTFDDVLRTLLPPSELKFVLGVLNDRATQRRALILIDDFDKIVSSSIGHAESIDNYCLDLMRLAKRRLLPAACVVCALRSDPSIGGVSIGIDDDHWQHYAIGGLASNHQSPLIASLHRVVVDAETIVDDDRDQVADRNPPPVRIDRRLVEKADGKSEQKIDRIDDQNGDLAGVDDDDGQDVLFDGVESTVSRLLARMSRPSQLSPQDCAQLLGNLALLTRLGDLPPLGIESRAMLERLRHRFQRDQQMLEDVADLLHAARQCGLLAYYDVGRRNAQPGDETSPIQYCLTFLHETLQIYLAAKAFVSMELSIDWHRLMTGRDLDAGRSTLFVYFLAGVDDAHARRLLSLGPNVERGMDVRWTLPWTPARTARRLAPFLRMLTDDRFVVIGSGRASDPVLLRKLTLDVRSGDLGSLVLESVTLNEPSDAPQNADRLSQLRLQQCRFGRSWCRAGRPLEAFANLDGLELIDCRFDDRLPIGVELPVSLTSLKLTDGRRTTTDCDRLLDAIGRLTKLHTLHLTDIRATSAVLRLIIDLRRADQLTKLYLRNVQIESDLLLAIADLPLIELDLGACRIFHSDWDTLAAVLAAPTPKRLTETIHTLRLDEQKHLNIISISRLIDRCAKLKLISARNSFDYLEDAQRFKQRIESQPLPGGFRRNVLI